jgi:N-acetylneuraminic acid mutarotase
MTFGSRTLAALALLTASSTFAQDAPPATAGTWAPAPPMLQARAAHAVVESEGMVYALAGTGATGRPVLEVERFDGAAWTQVTTIPETGGLNAPAAAALDGRIYLIGGFTGTSNLPTGRVSVYHVAAGIWTEAAPLPRPRGGHAAVVRAGLVHVFGGGDDQQTLADHSVYDPVTDTWRIAAPLPRDEGSPAGTLFEGEVYAIGGRSGGSDFGEVYVYQADLDAWRPAPPITPRGGAGATVYCGRIHVFGGETQAQGRTVADVLRLDLAAGAWVPDTPMPTARTYARAVTLGPDVYVVGGTVRPVNNHSSLGTAVVERFHVACP